MDWLFARYASPFSFIDGMIRTGRFERFVSSFVRTVNEEKEEEKTWQYYLHRVAEGSYEGFKASLKTNSDHKNMTQRTFETTINDSMRILEKISQKGGEA